MKATFIGHAPVLLGARGVTVLSDPWWLGPCSGAQWSAFQSPFVQALKGQRTDYVNISHGHHDHLHQGTLQALPKTAKVLVLSELDQAGSVRELGSEVIEVAADQPLRLGAGEVELRGLAVSELLPASRQGRRRHRRPAAGLFQPRVGAADRRPRAEVSLQTIEAARIQDDDLTYTTRWAYLRWTLQRKYGDEILFVGSGGIFDYASRRAAERAIHQELMALVRNRPQASRPARGSRSHPRSQADCQSAPRPPGARFVRFGRLACV